jgi:hypothetical protein
MIVVNALKVHNVYVGSSYLGVYVREINGALEEFIEKEGCVLASKVWNAVHNSAKSLSAGTDLSYEQAEILLLERFVQEIRG